MFTARRKIVTAYLEMHNSFGEVFINTSDEQLQFITALNFIKHLSQF